MLDLLDFGRLPAISVPLFVVDRGVREQALPAQHCLSVESDESLAAARRVNVGELITVPRLTPERFSREQSAINRAGLKLRSDALATTASGRFAIITLTLDRVASAGIVAPIA